MTYSKAIKWAVLSIVLVAAFGGCHTMRGVGADVERGGQVIQEQAR